MPVRPLPLVYSTSLRSDTTPNSADTGKLSSHVVLNVSGNPNAGEDEVHAARLVAVVEASLVRETDTRYRVLRSARHEVWRKRFVRAADHARAWRFGSVLSPERQRHVVPEGHGKHTTAH